MSAQNPALNDEIPQKLPHYTYVPGLTPHPVSDPRGHSFGHRSNFTADPLTQGIFLFNAGFYWEAHEAWEGGWILSGRQGNQADLLKGLIKLAACGVKCLEGNKVGAIRHAQRAAELFQQALPGPDRAVNADIVRVHNTAQRMAADPPLASAEQRLLARQGGVPILGTLPELRQ